LSYVNKTVMLFSSELIKGTLQSIVLSLLKSHQQMCGYELAQHIKVYTDNSMQFNEGSLYPVLYALEAQGLVTAETKSIGNRFRKYYSLSVKYPKDTLKNRINFGMCIVTLYCFYSAMNNLSLYIIISKIGLFYGRAPSGRAVRSKSSLFITAPG